jgi:radical SAM protein with 4Fe4S-binding SPASM domain
MLRNFLYRFKYRYGQHLPLTKPVDVSLELASYCTNTCGYCYHSDRAKLPFKKGFMDRALALNLVTEAAKFGVHSIKFNYRGESTMHPNFEEITRHAKRLSKGSTFLDRLTNSNFNFRSDREDIFRGLCNQTKVKVSFDSFIKDIFEKQRKGSNYQATINNIERFYNYPGRDNVLVVQAVRTSLNKDEDLEWEIKHRWPEAVASIRDCVEGRVDKDLSSIVTRKRDESGRQSCLQAHVRLIVGHDGLVQACCPDIKSELILGDAKKQTLCEIFNGRTAKQLRKMLKNKESFTASPCKGCSSFETYKGFKPQWES